MRSVLSLLATPSTPTRRSEERAPPRPARDPHHTTAAPRGLTVEDTLARERRHAAPTHWAPRPAATAGGAAGPMWGGPVLLFWFSLAGRAPVSAARWGGGTVGGGGGGSAGGGWRREPTPPPHAPPVRRDWPASRAPRAAAIALHVLPPPAGEDAPSRVAAAHFASWPGGGRGRLITPERRGVAARGRRPRRRAFGCPPLSLISLSLPFLSSCCGCAPGARDGQHGLN